MQYRDFPYNPYIHINIACPIFNIPHWLITIDEPALTHHNHPKSIVYITVTFGAVYYMDLEKCKMTCIHHHGIIQSVFTALKILYMPPFHPSPHPNFWKPLLFFPVSIVSHFPECHMAGII